MEERDPLGEEVAAIRDEGLLGRSEMLRRLFDYLAAQSLEARSPKEFEVAADVFGRGASFDPGQDAVVRVYIHKLRRRLEAIYAGPRREAGAVLTIPSGQYRLVLASTESRATPLGATIKPARPHTALLALAATGLVAATALATWAAEDWMQPQPYRENRALRRGAVWSPQLTNGLPTLVVVGDYYLFGESDDGAKVSRLVREYDIHSAGELDQFLMRHPDRINHYIDLDIQYLPVGAAAALRAIIPLVEPRERLHPVRVVLASRLTPEMLKTNNVVYVGYFSGLGPLKDTVMAGSRFVLDAKADDLVDRRSGRRYATQKASGAGSVYRDYGYFSTFRRPAGNQIVVVAGGNDAGLMQTAEAASRLGLLGEAMRKAGAGGGQGFEALWEVDGMSRTNLSGRLIDASRLGQGQP